MCTNHTQCIGRGRGRERVLHQEKPDLPIGGQLLQIIAKRDNQSIP
jgi:hypothetical protein